MIVRCFFQLVGGMGGKRGEREKELRRLLAEGKPKSLCTMADMHPKGNSKGGCNERKRKEPEPDGEEEDYAELARLRLEHNVKLTGSGQQR